MPNFRRITRRKARKYGLNPDIFERQIGQESGYDEDVIYGRRSSPAGAQGIAQIMPATARGWGVDPLKPRRALDAAARNMASYVRKYGSYENALRAYNAGPGAIQASKGYSETNKYVANILGGRDPGRLRRPARGGGTRGGTRGGGGGLAALTRITRTVTPGVSNKAARGAAIANFLNDRDSDPLSFALELRALKDTPRQVNVSRRHLPGVPGPGGIPRRGGSSADSRGPTGNVSVAPTADRPGVHTKPAVKRFVGQVAGRSGMPLMIGTGSNHSRLTVNGNVSDHWRGAAADVPLRGAALIRAGRSALVAAGMSRAQARKINGGLFNVGGWQIIFNTQEGGDHTDHLHVGKRS